MTRAAIYLRVSSTGQEDGTSFETQEMQCRQRCAEKGYSVVAVEKDTETGVDSAGYRPGLRRVRDLLQSGDANLLMIWKLDRYARESSDNLLLEKETKKYGAELESYVEGPIAHNGQGRMQLFIAGEAAQWERDSIVKRTREGIQRRVEAGMPVVGAAPRFGYRYVYGPGRRIGVEKKLGYELDPVTAQIVRRCYEAVDAGSSLNNLARQLNREGTPTPTQYLASQGLLGEKRTVATSWTRQTLYNLLSCPTYMGRHVANRYKVTKVETGPDTKPRKVKTLRDESDPTRVAIPTPAIVDEALWNRVQAAMTAHKAESSRHNPDPDGTLLRAGFAICGVCGRRMSTGRARGDHDRVYVCPKGKESSYMRPESDVCPGGSFSLRASMVDGPAWAEIATMARDPEKLQRIIEWRRKVREAKLNSAQAEADNVEEELAECRANLAKAERRMKAADDDDYALWKSEWKRQTGLLEQLEKRHRRADHNVTLRYANLERLKAMVSRAMFMLDNTPRVQYVTASDPLDGPTIEEKREIMRLLGVHVLMYPTDSDYARANGGKRYEVRCDEDADSVTDHE